jgi:H+/Na+-translocating ferredoxin:NAD+ oxidoreductase subunit G
MNFNKEKILSILPLTITSIICFIAIVIVHNLTKDKIIINKEQAALAIINEIIPVEYDNDLFHDKITIDVPAYINNTNKITVYRARVNDEPVAISLTPIITKGYNGNISLVIGIAYNGDLMGVRIINHNETEGFGDQAHQDNSKWLLRFNGYSLATPEEKWAIKKDGGEFDQLSGATITSRSIINIIYKTLEYYSQNRDKFYL